MGNHNDALPISHPPTRARKSIPAGSPRRTESLLGSSFCRTCKSSRQPCANSPPPLFFSRTSIVGNKRCDGLCEEPSVGGKSGIRPGSVSPAKSWEEIKQRYPCIPIHCYPTPPKLEGARGDKSPKDVGKGIRMKVGLRDSILTGTTS